MPETIRDVSNISMIPSVRTLIAGRTNRIRSDHDSTGIWRRSGNDCRGRRNQSRRNEPGAMTTDKNDRSSPDLCETGAKALMVLAAIHSNQQTVRIDIMCMIQGQGNGKHNVTIKPTISRRQLRMSSAKQFPTNHKQQFRRGNIQMVRPILLSPSAQNLSK